MEILRVENLTKIYGKKETQVVALDNVSFSVKKGEFVAIVGASGSGKSTLLHLIGGVDRPTKGKVYIDGKDKKKNNKIVVGDLELDLEKVEVKVKGEVKPLTPKEFELVKFLALQPGIPVTREVLLEKVWNYEYYGDIRTVDVTVCRIREKLGDSTKNSKIIINKRGIGYYLASK